MTVEHTCAVTGDALKGEALNEAVPLSAKYPSNPPQANFKQPSPMLIRALGAVGDGDGLVKREVAERAVGVDVEDGEDFGSLIVTMSSRASDVDADEDGAVPVTDTIKIGDPVSVTGIVHPTQYVVAPINDENEMAQKVGEAAREMLLEVLDQS